MLRHSSDEEPGYSRKKIGRAWAYYDEDGDRITDRREIDRLNTVALPPAYTDAWFCKDPEGHLQATGRDARGRKQYRYHPDFRKRRDKSKYADCIAFGEALPKLRARVEKDLRKRKLDRDTVLAAVVRLLDTEYMRVGNEEYARSNKSFGATTLRAHHLRHHGNKLQMRFKAKHGIVREVTITDRNLKRIVGKCQELPGQMLFQYVNGDGVPQPVTSADVNDYIREASGSDCTAKHFRTWGASVIFFEQMLEAEEERRLSLKTALEPVAEALGNTPAISRKSYVHPRLIEALQDNPRDPLNGMDRPRARRRLSVAETGFLAYLRKGRRVGRRKSST
ncbi:DNA topoisomerase IB [Sphingomonas sp. NSE70-1]|uniref:DNA topoisomerase n=1 Tax=Sphingomonas caseinilyticus TaxID=2908205 RepID=A0ABT0RQQ0_9SPHN|nr:DNA topoisomerase IB [Sphingomonas caseinilyticus]MCL6697236.1 DNA topoisomerase IB [Sphingomonas caseinilyticus]